AELRAVLREGVLVEAPQAQQQFVVGHGHCAFARLLHQRRVGRSHAHAHHLGLAGQQLQVLVERAHPGLLVQGLGHCGACHTPRGVGFQEKTMTGEGSKGEYFLAGETVENWRALSLRN
ncbi:hypothetical protein, partial [Burkholderia sola]|uniref:hypothetical protein n=1 Tax=Burkholderia sola TaxID=2843302 RepID=UPI00338EDB69